MLKSVVITFRRWLAFFIICKISLEQLKAYVSPDLYKSIVIEGGSIAKKFKVK